jgi:radical SAM protein with 4Fe4S-binding SPASM domain
MPMNFFKSIGKLCSAVKPLDALVNKNKFRKRLAERIVNMRKDSPFEYVLEITTRCNHLCKMCTFKHKEKTNRGDMSFDTYKKIIDQIPPDLETMVEFAGGGEPLLHKEFLHFIEYGKKKLPNSKFFLSTNGTFLDSEMGQKLIDANLDLLNIGLNAASKDGHKWLTNADDYDLIVNNAVNFFKMKNKDGFQKPLTFVQIIECKELESEIDYFKEFWSPIADKLHIRHVIAGMDERVLKSENITQIHPISHRRYPCTLPFRCISIGANGDLFPCNIYSHEGVPWSNVNRETIHNMWTSQDIINLRRIHLEDSFDKIMYCKDCDMWGYSDNVWIRNYLNIGKRKWL